MFQASCPVRIVRAASVAATLLASHAALAANLNVPSQYPTIQAAVAAAFNGDHVVLADGTYTGAANRNIDFCIKNIVVRSASGNPAACIIDCQDLGRAFMISGGQNANAGVWNLTIRNGNAFATPQNEGGGIYIGLWNATSCTISNCVFEFCRADKGGGIITDTAGSRPTIANCTFRQNTVVAYGGGMISDHDASASVVNCLFVGNTSTGGFGPGGALGIWGGSGVVRNCTFVGNSASFGSALSLQFDTTVVTNCIMWNNVNGALNKESAGSTVKFCDISGAGLSATPDANGNFGADPLFVNAAAGNYRLQAGSPCINRGSNAGISAPPFPFVGTTAIDLDGASRLCGSLVDVGAFETGGCQPAPALANGSFELGGAVGQLPVGSTSITGWTVTRGNVDWTNIFQNANGARSIDLQGLNSVGGVQHNAQTMPGRLYQLTFALAGNPDCAPTIKHMTARAGTTSANFQCDITGKTRTNMGWQDRSMLFVATAATTQIELFSTDAAGSCGAVVDNVRLVEAVPCRADFNGSGLVSVQDIFDFLGAYFANNPLADFNASCAISVQDIFDYLAAYFPGCV